MANKKKKSKTDNNSRPEPKAETKKGSASTSEIDDIFSKKETPLPSSTLEHEETPDTNTKKDTAEKKKDSTKDANKDEVKKSESNNKEGVVVFKQPGQPASMQKKKEEKRKFRANDDDNFSDSRGSKSRRTTEDGLPLFDVKELKIGEGGDTPLCPFDCDCCY
ncbi:uncharacterized protein VTP21DRAFT_5927 [Calcarisporiella thermophila]|uniref:uncharacterized protein n=1 Tax=Calcarisporiella thermophila TaxID=911321 RepID=UPI00374238F6